MESMYGGMFVGGQGRTPHSERRIAVISPTTEETIGFAPDADGVDVDSAVSAAREAFDDPRGWPSWSPSARAECLRRFAEALDARAPEVARLVSAQNGMPITLARKLEAVAPQILLRYYAGLIETFPFEEPRTSLAGGRTLVRREPLGVVAAIVPFNFPHSLAAYKYAPALAAGCTVVVKPSPETALGSELIADAATEAGLPPGVINIVPGGRDTGVLLVEHDQVDKVSFTGSTAAGRAIGEACGRLIRPVTLELGGKSAAIILDDADLDPATTGPLMFLNTLGNNGQICGLSTRILAPRSRYAEVLDLLEGMARALVIGDPLDPGTQIGPLVTERQRERVEHYIREGRAEGARVVTGGRRPARPARGWFIEPTIFADVDNRSTIAREEIFGPVLAVIPYDDEEDAIRIANDSPYGLGGSVWTRDDQRGIDVARRVRTGMVKLNGAAVDLAAPFGGVGASGIGVELGPEGLTQYQRLQSVYVS
ncbi:aldehyde dehydrogenase [Streptomyces liangshanensis]|uniref:Aldehyde dehydrogenase n=1 Tax=Streptomyces liangshanensis TaxID=2717324 RepID=A0A6G9GRT8_9ACTN|nr:aldehyde dehydrogenase [Streptomyces liangshanensis]QIQ00973.1 aldehyde dehydrogenase [Streptomyces liangshanensis]